MDTVAEPLNIFDELKGPFTEEQAHRLAEMFAQVVDGPFESELFVKRDIKELEGGIKALDLKIVETQYSLKELEAKMQSGFKEQEGRIKALDLKIAETQHGLKELEAKMQSGFKEQEGRIKALDLKIAETQYSLKELEAKMQSGFKEQEAKMQSGFKEQEGRIKALDLKMAETQCSLKELELQIARTKTEMMTEIGRSKVETIKWAVGLVMAQTAILAGILATYAKLVG